MDSMKSTLRNVVSSIFVSLCIWAILPDTAHANNQILEDQTSIQIMKGDTLQKISMRYFGTTRKWRELYKLNRDILSSPNVLIVGLKLKVKIVAQATTAKEPSKLYSNLVGRQLRISSTKKNSVAAKNEVYSAFEQDSSESSHIIDTPTPNNDVAKAREVLQTSTKWIVSDSAKPDEAPKNDINRIPISGISEMVY